MYHTPKNGHLVPVVSYITLWNGFMAVCFCFWPSHAVHNIKTRNDRHPQVSNTSNTSFFHIRLYLYMLVCLSSFEHLFVVFLTSQFVLVCVFFCVNNNLLIPLVLPRPSSICYV